MEPRAIHFWPWGQAWDVGKSGEKPGRAVCGEKWHSRELPGGTETAKSKAGSNFPGASGDCRNPKIEKAAGR